LLTTWPEKLGLLKGLGVTQVQRLVFDRKTASTSPEHFFRDVIVKKHRAAEMVWDACGLGKNRAGRLPLLKTLGAEYGVRIRVVSSVEGGKGPSLRVGCEPYTRRAC